MTSGWTGWQAQFLRAAGIIVTPPNMNFLTQWHRHAGGSCRNNLVDLSISVPNATRCGDTVAGFGRTKNYPTHLAAAHAFKLQMAAPEMTALRDALNTGNPFQIGDRTDAAGSIQFWGSVPFAHWYLTAPSGEGGGGGGGGSGSRGHVLNGWEQIKHSVDKSFPKAVASMEKSRRQTLRELARVHRVKL